MNAQISEVANPTVEPADPVEAVRAEIGDTDISGELGRLTFIIIKQAKYIAALQEALRKAIAK